MGAAAESSPVWTIGVIFNFPAGVAEIEATLAATKQPIGRVTVNVRAGSVITFGFPPTPLEP